MTTKRFLAIATAVVATAIVGAIGATYVADKRAAKRHRMYGVSKGAKLR